MATFRLNRSERVLLWEAHKEADSKYLADRIKCILHVDEGKSVAAIAQLLYVSEATIKLWIREYQEKKFDDFINDTRGGRKSRLSQEQRDVLFKWIDETHPGYATEVIQKVKEDFGIGYSEEGIRKILHGLGFVCKKARLVPRHPPQEVQEQFIAEYKKLRENVEKNDQIYFVDAAHLIFNTEAGNAWILKGKEFELCAQTGRKRINEFGAYSPIDNSVLVVENETVCNATTVIELFEKMKKENPKAKTIHVFLDNVRYHHACLVKEFAQETKIELHYLPPYAPNLNLVERLWRLLRKKVKRNKYYSDFHAFVAAIHDFFFDITNDKTELCPLITENFEVIL
jgi:transposase